MLPLRVASALLLSGCLGSSLGSNPRARAAPPAAAPEPAASAPEPAQPEAYAWTRGGCSETAFDFNAVSVAGRSQLTPEAGLRFGWSGTSLSSRFSGASLKVDLEDSGRNQFQVLIDGAPLARKLVAYAGRYCYELAADLEPGEHTITLTRLTEAMLGPSSLHGFVPEAGESLRAVPRKTRRIEVIGDSITAAYGVEGKDRYCHYSPDTQNHALGYGALLAARLDAELWTEAWSGKGIASNRGSKTDTVTMPELWQRVLPTLSDSPWDFARMQPDLLIVSLGTNDFAPENPDTSAFGPGYQTFVRQIRAVYPSALIVAALSPLLSDSWPPNARARSTARSRIEAAIAGDRRARLFEHELVTEAEGYGCDWHPSAKTHGRMARELSSFVAPLLGW